MTQTHRTNTFLRKTNTMASYVHKKISNNMVISFCIGWEQPNTVWKEGPCMRSAKFGPVTVTYWDQKGTLMFQRPVIPAANLNKQFICHKERRQETGTQQTGETLMNDITILQINNGLTQERQGKYKHQAIVKEQVKSL